MSNNSIFNLLKLRKYLTSKSKRNCVLLVLLSIQSAILDVISVASIIPFLGILLQNDNNKNYLINAPNFLKFLVELDPQNKLLLVSLYYL